MTNIEIDGSLYTINNLRPGTIYKCHATTILCGHMSAESKTVEECTGLYKYIQSMILWVVANMPNSVKRSSMNIRVLESSSEMELINKSIFEFWSAI